MFQAPRVTKSLSTTGPEIKSHSALSWSYGRRAIAEQAIEAVEALAIVPLAEEIDLVANLPIKCRLARRRDEATNFASRSAGIGSGNTEAKVLDDLSGGRICRAVVATIPAWIRVECLGLQQQWLAVS